MAIAKSLRSYLEHRNIEYDSVEHPHSVTALESAHSARVPGHQVAKAVVLGDDKGYVVAVVPSTNRLDLSWVQDTLGRDMELARESELSGLFRDCEIGAIPALCDAYGLDVIWDDQLDGTSDIYIEAGDHEHLIHVTGDAFTRLMSGMPHSVISAELDYSNWMTD